MKLWQEVIVWAMLGVMAFVAYEAFKAISTRIRDFGEWGYYRSAGKSCAR